MPRQQLLDFSRDESLNFVSKQPVSVANKGFIEWQTSYSSVECNHDANKSLLTLGL